MGQQEEGWEFVILCENLHVGMVHSHRQRGFCLGKSMEHIQIARILNDMKSKISMLVGGYLIRKGILEERKRCFRGPEKSWRGFRPFF